MNHTKPQPYGRHRNPTPRKYTLMEVLRAWFTSGKHFNPYQLAENPQS